MLFSDEEPALVKEAAALAELAPGAWLAEAVTRAARDAAAGSELPSQWSVAMSALMERQAEVAETRRLLRDIGGNLNQIGMRMDATGEPDAATARVVELVERAADRAEEVLEHLAALTTAARTELTRSRCRR